MGTHVGLLHAPTRSRASGTKELDKVKSDIQSILKARATSAKRKESKLWDRYGMCARTPRGPKKLNIPPPITVVFPNESCLPPI